MAKDGPVWDVRPEGASQYLLLKSYLLRTQIRVRGREAELNFESCRFRTEPCIEQRGNPKIDKQIRPILGTRAGSSAAWQLVRSRSRGPIALVSSSAAREDRAQPLRARKNRYLKVAPGGPPVPSRQLRQLAPASLAFPKWASTGSWRVSVSVLESDIQEFARRTPMPCGRDLGTPSPDIAIVGGK